MKRRNTLLFTLTILFLMSNLAWGAPAADTKVRLGIDNIDSQLGFFSGKRVGLITNATGMNSRFESTVDVLKAKTNLTALYSPEHGIRGAVPAGDTVGGMTDKKTGLPVYSLYGSTKKPTPDMLKDVDILAFDIQDVGSRPYTYIYTMAYAMQAAKETGKQFVVFDRPNPIGGIEVEGGLVRPEFTSFVGLYPIPYRHGLTVGELARLFNQKFGIGCDLTVIPMTGWKRSMYFADTGLPWVMTSPNIPTPETALVYPATGLFGSTNVSEGVGTTRPFDFTGAAWLDGDVLAKAMNDLALPGVFFRPASFMPQFGKYKGQTCKGVQLHITDPKAFKPLKTGLMLLSVIQQQGGDQFGFAYSDGQAEMFDLIVGDNVLRLGRYSTEELLAMWEQEAKDFKEMSKEFYLYQN